MSLLKFKSSTQGSIIMFGEDAQTLLDSLNLPAHGELTAAQLPSYLDRLKTIIESDKAANPVIWPEDLHSEENENSPVLVRFSQRASPMIQLMQRCISATETISW